MGRLSGFQPLSLPTSFGRPSVFMAIYGHSRVRRKRGMNAPHMIDPIQLAAKLLKWICPEAHPPSQLPFTAVATDR